MVEIRHLSVTARNPEKAAKALAEMTGGQAQPFISYAQNYWSKDLEF